MHAPAASPIDPELLLSAYRAGIFPMADARDDPEVFWVEPRMRAILPLDGFRMSASLARTLRRERFQVTCNAAFDGVIDACAAAREGRSETWISGRIAASYRELHRLGWAHSIECWKQGELVGGLYGVGFDRVFCGESMFSSQRDASKVALAWLVAALRRAGAALLDCQFMTDHLASLGAVEIDQQDYLARLRAAQVGVGAGLGAMLGVAEGEESGGAAGLDLPAGFAALLADTPSAAFAAPGVASSPGKRIAQSLTQTS
ncbi:leucyl/phenylalanyl-tRNA--protein transferase [Novosphingobium sp. Gsoil 351]|uniref:leucyl/phenylalanyl-tRNA--protein transferase n=1 Tax=Novosphingobium sp. Gsoil 351 TaxID=2675225 RepID=UPI0012B4F981|nr:leucyl/phenylalanyl-tRNA--protein transferase [Novosphingobium sp. Gsoil 351]QGN54791.1 leucyl/phenylalanyl-tRNA--protein transferase [Novosphingobium sp. Gsoil 351]